jgi:hypothetical protein
MNQDSVGLSASTLAALRICSQYADLFARRIGGFLQGTRSEERPDHLSRAIAVDNIDEMLFVVPGATAAKFWDDARPPVEHLPREMASPFGDA